LTHQAIPVTDARPKFHKSDIVGSYIRELPINSLDKGYSFFTTDVAAVKSRISPFSTVTKLHRIAQSLFPSLMPMAAASSGALPV